MNTTKRLGVLLSCVSLYLAGCGQERTAAPAPASRPAQVKARPAPEPAPTAPLVHGQRLHYDNIDDYKEDVANHIMRTNTAHTFSGKLPPLLPAIVVLRITVNADGRLTDVFIQRARHKVPSEVALASMKRAGLLPKPLNLIQGQARTLSFSETFLFNDDDRFQLRTLAGPQ